MTPEFTPAERNAVRMADLTFAALASPVRPRDDSEFSWNADEEAKWAPLIRLLGCAAMHNFMYMGECGDLVLYKHVLNRRYLNIDRKTGQTYRHTSGVIPSGYEPIAHDEALEYVHEGVAR